MPKGKSKRSEAGKRRCKEKKKEYKRRPEVKAAKKARRKQRFAELYLGSEWYSLDDVLQPTRTLLNTTVEEQFQHLRNCETAASCQCLLCRSLRQDHPNACPCYGCAFRDCIFAPCFKQGFESVGTLDPERLEWFVSSAAELSETTESV